VDSLHEQDRALLPRLRALLETRAAEARVLTYAEAARALALAPPQTIHRTALMLETLIAEDAAAARPLIAALVISRTGAVPKPGFFACAALHGVYDGAEEGPEAEAFHAAQLAALKASNR
jgi:hypothetical protein